MPRRSLVKQEPIAELQGACPGLKHWYWHVDVKVAAIRQHCMQRTQLALATRARYNSLRHPNRMFHAAQARSPLYTNKLPSAGAKPVVPSYRPAALGALRTSSAGYRAVCICQVAACACPMPSLDSQYSCRWRCQQRAHCQAVFCLLARQSMGDGAASNTADTPLEILPLPSDTPLSTPAASPGRTQLN